MISYMIKRFSKTKSTLCIPILMPIDENTCVYHFNTTYCIKKNTNYTEMSKPLSPRPSKLCYI
jgi:hypothetical protein